jgi:anti-sigma-K factor RskA
MGEHGNQHGNTDRGSREGHAWAREMLGPYVLGALDQEEEKAVERHLEGCAACRDEECGLRETHQLFAGASIAASSPPPELKARVRDALPGRDRRWPARVRGALSGTARAGRGALAAAAVLLLFALAAVAYSMDMFDRTVETASLAPTDLAPQAGGDLEVRGSGPNMKASLEVWGLPETEPDEYYELWLGREGGRVSVGTFTVDDGGRGELSTLCPEVAGGYQRAGVTLERFPEEPRMDSARAVLRGDLPES